MPVRVLPDTQQLIQAAAEHVCTLAVQAIAERGIFTFALCGGSTPRPLYLLLSSEAYFQRIDWSRVHIFWGDERCVPPDDVQSNYRLARETLLDEVPLPPGNIHRMHGEEEPSTAATAYEIELRSFFPAAAATDGFGPRMDLILLGMGEDGHTASLFPGTPAVMERDRWVLAQYVEKASSWRITLTPVIINSARNVAFIVSGPEKTECLHRVIEGPFQPEVLPAQIVRPERGTLVWLADASAAGLLGVEKDRRSTSSE